MLPAKEDYALSCSISDYADTRTGIVYTAYSSWYSLAIPAGIGVALVEATAHGQGDPEAQLNNLTSLVGTLELCDDAGLISSMSIATTGKVWGVGTPPMYITEQGFFTLARPVTKYRAKMAVSNPAFSFHGPCTISFDGFLRRYYVPSTEGSRDQTAPPCMIVQAGAAGKQATKFRYKVTNSAGGDGWDLKVVGTKLYRFTED